MSLINYLEQIIGNLESQIKILKEDNERLKKMLLEQNKIIEEYKKMNKKD